MARSILIIDDEPDIRELVAFKLEQIGFQVHVESDGETGMAAIVRLHPDLVVLDWMMPRLSGIDLCERLRERPESERVPIIMLTARAQAADVLRGFEVGVDDYIVKPFSLQDLANRVKAVLALAD